MDKGMTLTDAPRSSMAFTFVIIGWRSDQNLNILDLSMYLKFELSDFYLRVIMYCVHKFQEKSIIPIPGCSKFYMVNSLVDTVCVCRHLKRERKKIKINY